MKHHKEHHDGHHEKKTGHKMHPHHKGHAAGGGMPYFEKEHWQKPVEDIECGGGRYASEMGAASEYRESVDKLAEYARKHRAEH